jgi:steroid delta-isomerase-like uncharacterized protein
MSTEENKALIRHLVEETNKHNVNKADEMFAPDVVGHFPGLPPVQGLDACKQLVSGMLTAFPDLQLTVEDLIAEGDKVVFRETWRGTHQGAFQGIPPTGKQVTFTGMAICRIVGGKIAEEWAVHDDLGLLQQLGAIPQMAQGGA